MFGSVSIRKSISWVFNGAVRAIPVAVVIGVGVGLLAGPGYAQNVEIGVTAAVNPEALGKPPAAAARVLHVGINVFSNEAVTTGVKGQTQMLFLDESALTIGPNSSVVLDEFVYDPNAKAGKIALNAVKGVFRFVGGRISKKSPVILKTPTATIGIRGGITLLNVADAGATQAIFLFGDSLTIESEGVTRQITRPGFQVSVSPGEPPSEPAPATKEDLNQSLSALEEGGRDEEEGDGDAVSDSDVAESGLDEEGSSNAPSDLAPTEASTLAAVDTGVDTTEIEDTAETDTASQTTAASNTGLTISSTIFGRLKHATTSANGTDDSSSTLNLAFSDGSVSNGIFTASTTQGEFVANIAVGSFSAESTSQPFGTATLTGTGFVANDETFGFYELTDSGDGHKVLGFGGVPVTGVPTSGTSFYALQDDFVMDSKVPFVRGSDSGSLTPPESESTADTAIVWDTSGSSTAHRAFGHRTMVISGTGTSQKSVMSLAVGEVTLSGGLPRLDGAMLATSRLSTSGALRITDGDIAAAESGTAEFFGGGTDVNYFVIESDTDSGSDAIDVAVGGSDTAIFPNAIALPASDNVGTRTSKTMNGYSGGSLQVVNSSGTVTNTVVFQNETGDPNDITVKTSSTTNKITADINVKDANTSLFTFLRADFGDLDTAFGDSSATSGHSIFVDNQTMGAEDEEKSGVQPVTINTGTTSDVTLGMISVTSSGEFDSGFIPSGVSVCSCSELTWGFWSGDYTLGSNSNEIHMATWVAGEIPALSAISALSGSASYTGHAIGNVVNSSDVYLAIGSWSYNVNFDSPSSSSGTLTSFDSGSYSMGGLTLSSGTNSMNTFSGSITGTSGTGSGKSGSLLGSFMKSSTVDNANMGGHFSISGTNYKASGIFAATK